MRVSAVMTGEIATLSPDATMRRAVGMMLRHRIGSVLVVDDGVVGILTRTDVLHAVHDREDPLTLPVEAGMSSDVHTIGPTRSISDALRTMAEHGIRRLPVRDGLDVVGIVTLTDIARHQPERVQEVRDELSQRNAWTD